MARVVLENVRVDFPIYGAQRSLRTAIFQQATGGLIRREGRHDERVVVRALSDVSLRLEEGDRLGLVGHNGSGKSTLLKVIAGIHEPIAGRRMVEGRVTPLFDVMPGLDVEDTGYENILTSGMLLGMSRREVESKILEIEEFCELGEYLALPVRTYSAGMTMRLSFALVTALEPGVLVMDEGFGTGDLRFTERARERVDEFMGRSRIIVLASHSDQMIKSMCNKAALMQEGQILAVGAVDDVLEQYKSIAHAAREAASSSTASTDGKSATDTLATEPGFWNLERSKSDDIELLSVSLCGARSGFGGWVTPDEDIELKFRYKQFRDLSGERFVFQLLAQCGEVAFTATDQGMRGGKLRPAGEYITACVIPGGLLNIGVYLIRVWAGIPGIRFLVPPATLGCFVVVGPGNQGPTYETDDQWSGVLCPKLAWRITAIGAQNATIDIECI